MPDYQVVLGFASVVIGICAYIPTFRDIIRGTNKPHPFTWLVFAILNGIVFFGQLVSDGGAGSWMLAMTTIASLILALVGFRVSAAYIKPIDYGCLAGAFLGIALWIITKEPLSAIVVATVVDAIAFIPTIRKTYYAPYTETPSAYVLGTMKYLLSIPALSTPSFTNVLYPASIVVLNSAFLLMVYIRRRTHHA